MHPQQHEILCQYWQQLEQRHTQQSQSGGPIEQCFEWKRDQSVWETMRRLQSLYTRGDGGANLLEEHVGSTVENDVEAMDEHTSRLDYSPTLEPTQSPLYLVLNRDQLWLQSRSSNVPTAATLEPDPATFSRSSPIPTERKAGHFSEESSDNQELNCDLPQQHERSPIPVAAAASYAIPPWTTIVQETHLSYLTPTQLPVVHQRSYQQTETPLVTAAGTPSCSSLGTTQSKGKDLSSLLFLRQQQQEQQQTLVETRTMPIATPTTSTFPSFVHTATVQEQNGLPLLVDSTTQFFSSQQEQEQRSTMLPSFTPNAENNTMKRTSKRVRSDAKDSNSVTPLIVQKEKKKRTTYCKATFSDYLKALEEFVGEHGHCRVPTNWKDGKLQLGRWVQKIRRAYKKLSSSTDDATSVVSEGAYVLTRSRVEQLERMGFEWAVNNKASWDDRYNELVAFVKQNGRWPARRGDNETVLGEWMHSQRRQYRSGSKSLLAERLDKLNAIDFPWNPRLEACLRKA